MKQQSLFATHTDHYGEQTYSRRTDPDTSHAAAREHVASGAVDSNRRLCLAVVRKHPGMTAAEVADVAGVERHEASRRLPELRRAGLVVNGAKRLCEVTGNGSMTWVGV